MASLDFDQKFLGRIAKQTSESNPFLSDALYQILGLSVLLARRLVRARKLRKLDTTRDTPSLSAYQHILWMSREGLSLLELHVLPYAQDNQYGPECRVLSVKLRASFYHIFCLFHNQPPVTSTNLESTDSRLPGVPPVPISPTRRAIPSGLSPPSKRSGKQSAQRDSITSIVSESSFVTNPYAGAGGPVGTPSPRPIMNAPPGLNPIPIPQPSSFLLPPLNFVPLASGYFSTATSYAASFLPGSHPLRLSVALEHSAFLWDCLHDHDASRRVARRAIKDVYRAQEAMDDTEFEDAAELVGILGRMMKRKSWEGTPRVGDTASPAPLDATQTSDGGVAQPAFSTALAFPQQPPYTSQSNRRATEALPNPEPSVNIQSKASTRSGPTPATLSAPPSRRGHLDTTARPETQRHNPVSISTRPPPPPPRVRHASIDCGASTTPKAPATALPTRTAYQHTSHSVPLSQKPTSQLDSAASPFVAPEHAYHAPTIPLRRSPTLHERAREYA